MKIIQTLELNEDLANIKKIEQSILTDKITFIAKFMIISVVLAISCYSIWGFVLDSVLSMPDTSTLSDIFVHVCMQIIQNLLISASICFVVTSILKSVKYIGKALMNT